MKKYFVDTNVLVDLIADRKPYSKHAVKMFSKAESNQYDLYTSSHSMATTYYLLKKYIDEKSLRKILIQLMDFIHVIEVSETIIKKALHSSQKDVEDAIQLQCAYTIKNISGVVTRNTKDFKGSEIPVFAPDELQ